MKTILYLYVLLAIYHSVESVENIFAKPAGVKSICAIFKSEIPTLAFRNKQVNSVAENRLPKRVFSKAPNIVLTLDGSLLRHSIHQRSANMKGFVSDTNSQSEPVDYGPLNGDDEGETEIWEVQNGGLTKRTDINDYTLLESDKVYVVLQANIDKETEFWNLYYWIGKYSRDVRTHYCHTSNGYMPDDDAGDAASHSIFIDCQIHSTIKINRQVQGEESIAFTRLFSRQKTIGKGVENGKNKSTTSEPSVLLNDDENAKRMFVVGGRSKLYMKEVDLTMENMTQNDECVVFVSENVYAFCGGIASYQQRRASVKLARVMLKRKGRNSKAKMILWNPFLVQNSSEEREKCLQCIKELQEVGILDEVIGISVERKRKPVVENPNEFTPFESRWILDQTNLTPLGLELFPVFIFKIYEFYEEYESNEERILRGSVTMDHCYLIDSQSNAGLFVWMGRESSMNIRIECARRAEHYLRERKYDLNTLITYVDMRNLPPELYSVQQLISVYNPIDTDTTSGLFELFESHSWRNFILQKDNYLS